MLKKIMICLIMFGSINYSFAELEDEKNHVLNTCLNNSSECFIKEIERLESLIDKVLQEFSQETLSVITKREQKNIDTSYNSEYYHSMINHQYKSYEYWRQYRDMLCISNYYEDQMTSGFEEIVNGCRLGMTKEFYEKMLNALKIKLADWKL